MCIVMLIMSSSCNRSGNGYKSVQHKDSLRVLCEKYAVRLDSDTLRTVANEYLNASELYSRDYFKARHFLILADFNAHDYPLVLTDIDQVASLPHFGAFADIDCRYEYTRARAFQYSQNSDAAIASFKKCLTYDSSVDSLRRKISATDVNAMLQMMNTYLAAGKHEECEAYFMSLIRKPTPLIKAFCLRDLYSIAAYSFYMNDDTRRAAETMDRALCMPCIAEDPQSLFRDYSYAAVIYNEWPERQPLSIELGQKALKIGYAHPEVAGMEWLTDWFGSVCKQTGKIEKAIDLYQESIVISRQKGNVKGQIEACGRLNELYIYLNQYDLANSFANLALEKAKLLKDNDPEFMGKAYLKKATTMLQMNKPDSALYFGSKADAYFSKLPYNNGSLSVDEMRGELFLNKTADADRRKGIAYIRHALTMERDGEVKANLYLKMADGYMRLNRQSEGEAMLDSMYVTLKSFSTPIYITGAYQLALKHYLKTGNMPMIKRYAAEYLDESSHVFNTEVAKKMSQFTIKYNMEKKEQLLRITQYELKNKELHLQLVIVFTVILIVILLSCVFFFIYKRRIYNLHKQLMSRRFNDLSDRLATVTERRAMAEKELEDMLQDMNNKQTLQSVIPEMYRDNGEGRFRSRFNRLYPSFISNLHARCPDMTNKEEIYCMLLILKQTTEQISDIFCIEKKSVNMIRYRVRNKMQLEKNESIEDAMNGLLK